VYDEAMGESMLFGGLLASGAVDGDTWTWDGSSWTQRFPATSPPARLQHGMAYVAARQEVVLFGGQVNGNASGDTWTWDGTTWTDRTPPVTTPVPRVGPGFAYDATRKNSVLFGGTIGGDGFDDTWIWDGSTWIQQHPASTPPGRYGGSMAYDRRNADVVLFGGSAFDGGAVYYDTWTWDGSNWTERTPSTVPPERLYEALAFDGARNEMVMFGGAYYLSEEGYFYRNDTWVWNGTTWLQRLPAHSPSERSEAAVAYDAATRQVVLFGGGKLSGMNDTWTWNGIDWTQQSPANTPPKSLGARMVYDPSRRVVVLFVADGTTWAWDGTNWSKLHLGGSPPPRRDAGMAYDVARRGVVLFGGQGTTAPLGDTWILFGSTWHMVP